MDCPNCHQTIEIGAAFCGNCGQPLQASTIVQVLQNQAPASSTVQPPNKPIAAMAASASGVPSYALAAPRQHTGETRALLALLFGLAGVVGALFMALVGLAFGITGIVMGTMSHSGTKKGLSTAGLVASSLAVLVSLAVWTYAIRHDPRFNQAAQQSTHGAAASTISASGLSTPCYSAGFVDKLNITNNAASCDMSAFNGSTLESSTNAYKVYADTSQTANPRNFTSIVKPALEKDVKDSLPNFNIDSERTAQFAGSLAYIVSTSNPSQHVAVTEAAVLHQVDAGDNVFILVHAVNGSTADLSTLEAQWQWK